MRYFFDTEFLEDGRTIELISIGIVAEDGREYYAEADLSLPVYLRVTEHKWLMANVWPHLTHYPKPLTQIAEEVRTFITGNRPEFWAYMGAYDWVVLNQLYGSMVEHPTKWQYYCNDVAQLALYLGVNHRLLPSQTTTEHNALADARWTRDCYYHLVKWKEERDQKCMEQSLLNEMARESS